MFETDRLRYVSNGFLLKIYGGSVYRVDRSVPACT